MCVSYCSYIEPCTGLASAPVELIFSSTDLESGCRWSHRRQRFCLSLSKRTAEIFPKPLAWWMSASWWCIPLALTFPETRTKKEGLDLHLWWTFIGVMHYPAPSPHHHHHRPDPNPMLSLSLKLILNCQAAQQQQNFEAQTKYLDFADKLCILYISTFYITSTRTNTHTLSAGRVTKQVTSQVSEDIVGL